MTKIQNCLTIFQGHRRSSAQVLDISCSTCSAHDYHWKKSHRISHLNIVNFFAFVDQGWVNIVPARAAWSQTLQRSAFYGLEASDESKSRRHFCSSSTMSVHSINS